MINVQVLLDVLKKPVKLSYERIGCASGIRARLGVLLAIETTTVNMHLHSYNSGLPDFNLSLALL